MTHDTIADDLPPELADDDAPDDEAPPENCDGCGGTGYVSYSRIDCRRCCGEGVIRCAKT